MSASTNLIEERLPRPPIHIAGLDARTPLCMLPVNIETRFMDIGAVSELWVRIYPDQLAINSFDPALTAQEIADGKTYWDAVWSAGKSPADPESIKAPWRGLASLYGSSRAAWIARAMTPVNVSVLPAAPTPAGSAPSVLPIYPTPATRQSSWDKPSVADALPAAWTVVTIAGNQTNRYHGAPIIAGLAIGPTPRAGAFPPGSPVDAGMKWIVDFDTALAAGMALKISLTAAQRAAGFDRILVYGLRGEQSGSAVLAGLLDAHHYSDGFALVPQGSPTNNTPDASSAFSRKDPGYERSFATELGDPLDANAQSDGAAFARMTGIDPSYLAHVENADTTGVLNGIDMLTATWQGTLGYFLGQMMADVFTPTQIEDARQYILANAIPRGAVPAFRVGRTPYGVIPVTAPSRYQAPAQPPTPSTEAALVQLVHELWPTWLASSATAPHFQRTGDPDQELSGVLGMDASSMTFRGRQILGDNFLWNYSSFLGISYVTLNQWWADHLLRGRQLLDTYGETSWDPRVIHLAMPATSFPVNLPTVQPGALSETDPLKADANLTGGKKGNYIQWIRQASITDLQSENYPGTKPNALLYLILRISMLQEYANTATASEISAGRLQSSQMKEAEIVGIQQPPAAAQTAAVSPWEVLARPSVANPRITYGDYLVAVDAGKVANLARLAQMRASLDRLALLPTAELDRLLTETLDACSHRLDVWVSAIAHAILNRARAAQINTSHLGCFGWVEDVRPAAARAPVRDLELQQVQNLDALRQRTIEVATQSRARGVSVASSDLALMRSAATAGVAATTPAGSAATTAVGVAATAAASSAAVGAVPRTPLQPMEDSGGYIFAPSLAQASAAAVLRSGYMTHKGTADEPMLSIDLSSERVRKALSLFDGIRQGQTLGALLGYIFETGLHDLNLDKYAQPFRDRFPIVGDKLTPSSDPSESVAASNVVDGVALRTAWDAGQLNAGQNWGTGLPGPGADQNNIVTLLKSIDDYADSLSDVSIAEAVFQIIRGNFGRAGSPLDAISKGLRPPEPEIVNTPRGGTDLTHRVAILLAGNPAPNAGWSGITPHPRAAAEPWLNTWLGNLLPDPATVQCEVTYEDAAGNHSKIVRLSDLDVGPLDCLAMAAAADIAQRGEIENRILYRAALAPDAVGTAINYQSSVLPADSISFPDFLYLAKAIRELVGSGRALTPQDLSLPEKKAEDHGGAVDLVDLRSRATAALASLTADVAALDAVTAGLPGVTPPVRSALVKCSYYGISGSIPLTASGPDAGLSGQATSVSTALHKRIAQASALTIATASAADLTATMQTMLGADFVLLPRFTPPDFASLQSAFGQSAALVASDPQAPARWLMQLTHLRPVISRLDSALTLAQVLGPSTVAPQDLTLGQMPAMAGDKWLGLGIDPANPPSKGRVAFACIAAGDPTAQKTYAGILLDEWNERIPSASETAAVAFHYDQPDARAPQAILLAVCPDSRATWDDDLITATLTETLDLARIRTVDLDSVQQVGQILPGLYFALNLKSATISTDFISHIKEAAIALAAIHRG